MTDEPAERVGGGGIVLEAARYPGRAPIDAYGAGGFRFAEMSHRGDLLCLPDGIHAWERGGRALFDPEAFAGVVAQAAGIELLIVGCGVDLRPVPQDFRDRMREAGIRVDSMSTGAAVRTFNVLLSEGRAVAAALIATP